MGYGETRRTKKVHGADGSTFLLHQLKIAVTIAEHPEGINLSQLRGLTGESTTSIAAALIKIKASFGYETKSRAGVQGRFYSFLPKVSDQVIQCHKSGRVKLSTSQRLHADSEIILGIMRRHKKPMSMKELCKASKMNAQRIAQIHKTPLFVGKILKNRAQGGMFGAVSYELTPRTRKTKGPRAVWHTSLLGTPVISKHVQRSEDSKLRRWFFLNTEVREVPERDLFAM